MMATGVIAVTVIMAITAATTNAPRRVVIILEKRLLEPFFYAFSASSPIK
jgi:hypothetical protein